jgi:hypothetical protein
MAPLILGLGAIIALIIQVLTPMRLDYFLSIFPQQVSMFLVFCLLANCSSIQAPFPLAAGVFRRSDWRGMMLLYNLLFSCAFLAIQAPMLLPYGIEKILEDLGWVRGWPICLVLSLLELVGVAFFYRFILDLEGRWLQSREKKILEIVATKTE